MVETFKKFIASYGLALAWIQAILATLGSLFFSEILNYPPCVLCWYQRIAIYPLVFILGIAYFKKDSNVSQYVLPLLVVGWGISIFHNLLYWKILPEAAAPCQAGISCTTKYVEYFGFVTIPFLAFLAITTIIVLVVLQKRFAINNN